VARGPGTVVDGGRDRDAGRARSVVTTDAAVRGAARDFRLPIPDRGRAWQSTGRWVRFGGDAAVLIPAGLIPRTDT